MSPRFALLVVPMLLAGACMSGPAASSPTTSASLEAQTAVPTSPSSTSMSPSPVAFESGAAVCSATSGLPCFIEPGAYTPTLVPTLTLTVGDGWEAIADSQINYFMLHRGAPETGFSIASPVLRGAGDVTIGSGRQAFADFLGSVQGLVIENTTDVSVGGLPAKQLDIRATTDLKTLFVIGQSDMPAEIAPYYELLSGRVGRVYAVDATGATVIIVIEPGPGTTLEAALAISMPIIESIDVS